jgi:hypothetical protein
VKGISNTTLIRLGALWGVGSVGKGVFGVAWGCHSPQRVETIYTTLVEKLKDRRFGPFDALSVLIGEPNARVFCEGQLRLPSRPSQIDDL